MDAIEFINKYKLFLYEISELIIPEIIPITVNSKESTHTILYYKSPFLMLENFVGYYRKSDGKTQKEDTKLHLFKKIVLKELRGATCEFTTPINVLINASKVLKSLGIRQEVENDLLSCLAPQIRGERFPPLRKFLNNPILTTCL